MREILRRHDKVTPLEKREKGGQCFVNDYRVVRTVKEDKLSKVILCERGGNLYAIKKYKKKGTYEFMPPEFFSSGKCYSGEKVDIWSLGISLYALFYRVIPFVQKESLLQLFQDIGRGHVQYPLDRNYFLNEYTKKEVPSCVPSLLSTDIDFLKNLLRRDPGERPTSEEALKHEWLKDVDYACLEQYAKETYKKRTKL
ncbi:serine/threonine protein kinase [Plasmodium cynomolgi strain B]|uniref:Serine/threonine protein kinase n=1 Tax=Plasmodium cynomolgi (strain B) TaxID=1120755 RepID=K6UCJ6_PLACD|nr:serine/threonine protein kinase [Plasmodium cynomolgi strain B]GAB64966.1 serine/threonine protein kinase [Plasmodium cynomolgi strain B]